MGNRKLIVRHTKEVHIKSGTIDGVVSLGRLDKTLKSYLRIAEKEKYDFDQVFVSLDSYPLHTSVTFHYATYETRAERKCRIEGEKARQLRLRQYNIQNLKEERKSILYKLRVEKELLKKLQEEV